MNEILNQLPKMLTGRELRDALTVLPDYDEAVCQMDSADRLMYLSDIYRIYIPSQMSVEIYSKLYLSMIRSLQKKNTRTAVMQRNENYRRIQSKSYDGIIGGSDSFTIIGCSGIGKSSAIANSIQTATDNVILEIENPYVRIIPCVICQCPHDCSVKGLLLEVLRKIDESIGSNYYKQALRARATTDMLIGNVSQAALNHIGVLVIDEIQNVCHNRNGINLVSVLTQLINNSGISICMVGTPESANFFEKEMQLARRSLGLQYMELPYSQYFKMFCQTVYRYQYVRKRTELSDLITEWLYEHSSGLVSLVISLIHDAQEIAIMNGNEILDLHALDIAYQERLKMMHDYIRPAIITKQSTTVRNKKVTVKKALKKETLEGSASETEKVKKKPASIEQTNIHSLIMNARNTDENIIDLLRDHICIAEVAV